MSTGPVGSKDPAHEPAPPFARILCAVDGSPVTALAAAQAVRLAGPGAAVRFRYVAPDVPGASGRERVAGEVEAAMRDAAQAGASATFDVVTGGLPREILVREAAGHDLVVVGAHERPRAAGIVAGSVTTHLAHRGTVSVLVARAPFEGETFGRNIVVASDGSEDSARAVDLGARLAMRLEGRVTLLHVSGGATAERSHRIAEQSAELYARLAVEPLLRTRPGPVVDAIRETVMRDGASLLVVGSRGLTGVKALGSVSERMVHDAPCSVLVVRRVAGG